MATAKKTVTEIDAQRAQLALEWQKIIDRITPDLERIDAIKAELETLPVSKYAIPGVDLKVDVSQGTSFMPAEFMSAYPITKRPDLYKAVPDMDRIGKAFSPEQLKAFRKANKTSVKLV